MRRLISKALMIGIVGTLATGLAPGCADNDSILFVRAVLKAEAPSCIVKPDPSAMFLGGGVIDNAFRDDYWAALLVGNQMARRGKKDLLRTESSRVVLHGAEVRLLNDQEATLAEFTVPGSGFVDPGTGDDPGYGILATQLVPSGLSLPGNTLVVSEVRVFGESLGGEEIESATLRFPIIICTGCLISYPQSADDAAQPGYQCVSTEETTEDLPCHVGQDDPIDCRLCADMPICQSP